MAQLWVVATPIGNLSDMSEHVIRALRDCDLIAAEDTRVTMQLLNHLGLKKPLVSCHRHNERAKSAGLIERMLEENLTVALTCDAGTPGISDPGVYLVRAAIAAGIPVSPVCGPSALTAAISASGFDATRFTFHSFPPREKGALTAFLQTLLHTDIPVHALYESPHRVIKLTETIAQVCPGARVSVACDISKRFEKILVGDVSDVLGQLRENPNAEKGEYVVLIDLADCQKPEAVAPDKTPEEMILAGLLDGLDLADAADRAIASGLGRNAVYKAKLRLKALFET